MKNAFALSSLILPASYSVALAAEMIGAVSFRVPGFFSFIALYAAVGILAFAFSDYFRQARVSPDRALRTVPRRVTVPARHVLSLSSSTLRTN